MTQIKVTVAGAKGKMGQEVIKMIESDQKLLLTGCLDRTLDGVDVGDTLFNKRNGILFYNNIEKMFQHVEADVLVDFTTPFTVKQHASIALRFGISPVIGTTGLTEEDLTDLDKLCETYNRGAVVAPNFAIGAVLMMKFAAQAAKYLPDVEIIEMHHDQKLDSPSGTALKTAQLITQERVKKTQGHPNESVQLDGSRGANYEGMRIHSVRLPGYVAHQQVIFGGIGQTLTLRHDSIHRQSFMPGVNLAIKEVGKLKQLIYGLEHLLE